MEVEKKPPAKKRGRPEGKHPENWKRHTPYVTTSVSGSPAEIQRLKEKAKEEGKTVSRYVLDQLKDTE